MPIFDYGQKEIDFLKRKDKKLSAAIDRIGIIQREITPDPFTALVSSVVSQQISKKAADTVWKRLCMLLGDITPENKSIENIKPESISPESIAQVGLSEIQACGMSERKAGHIKGIADAALSGVVDFKSLHTKKAAMPLRVTKQRLPKAAYKEEVFPFLMSVQALFILSPLVFSIKARQSNCSCF